MWQLKIFIYHTKGVGVPRKLQFLVNGEWRDTKSGEYMPVTNSSTGEVMAEAPKRT
jgi:malonate-semialdehyde dehydrogenase (acetylating)/methylmalonate-semialdehyde dehydrogenase